MEPYISIGKESIEKERIGIDRYISRNKRKGNEKENELGSDRLLNPALFVCVVYTLLHSE